MARTSTTSPQSIVRDHRRWLTVVMLAVDLIAWTQLLLLHGVLAQAEPKTLRYRLLHGGATSRARTLSWVA